MNDINENDPFSYLSNSKYKLPERYVSVAEVGEYVGGDPTGGACQHQHAGGVEGVEPHRHDDGERRQGEQAELAQHADQHPVRTPDVAPHLHKEIVNEIRQRAYLLDNMKILCSLTLKCIVYQNC